MDNNAGIKNEILIDFLTLNNLTLETEQVKLYELYINKAVQSILNITNREIFPKELKYTVLDMIDEFYTLSNNKAESSNSSNEIKSLSEEGKSVTFVNKEELKLTALLSNHITESLDLRKKEIYRYRLMYRK